MIGLALSGGGSRAMAFHLGCLRALHDLDLLERIGVLSTISGGSVIGAYYAYTPGKPFDEFENDIRSFLKSGFQRSIALGLAKPQNLFPSLASFITAHIHDVAARLGIPHPNLPRFFSRTDVFYKILHQNVFSGLTMTSPRRNNLKIVIGACELRTGSAFRFGDEKSGNWRNGQIIGNCVDIAFAVAASAAYPIFLPALDRQWTFRRNGQDHIQRVLLTDGGVYDNLGVQALEPDRNPEYSLHTFPCQYLIACNAGMGQEAGRDIPLGFFARTVKSFGIVHRRVQDSTVHRLHQLRETGSIKGFALPYLGQQDNQLPWQPPSLVPRAEVIDYPTDFGRMPEQWIDKLSNRGEQLTRLLVSHYLQDLL
jgi:NTE family protein